jgi:hypothetical protein
MIGSTVTSRPQTPPASRSSGGTYSSYECGRFGLSCSNFDPKKAAPQSSGFNPFSWAVNQVQHHWRGIVQAAVFVSCLSLVLAVCLVAEGIGVGADYVGGAIQYGAFSKNALLPAAKSIAIDLVSLPFGYAVQQVLDEGVILASGLRAADTEDIRGLVGSLAGSYAPYIPRHSSDFVDYNQAVQFFAHPVPVLVQMGGRAAVNGASCNGGDVTEYCGG